MTSGISVKVGILRPVLFICLLKFLKTYCIYLLMCCLGLNLSALECSVQDHISAYGHMDQIHVHSISNVQNGQVRQYIQVHCSICAIINIIPIHCIIKNINFSAIINVICVHHIITTKAYNFVPL